MKKFWLAAAGAVGTIIGGKILKSPTTRKLAVQGLAKGMMIQGDAKEALQNMKDEAEDICYEARQEAENSTSNCIEEHFPHSVARAIVNAAKEKGIVHAEEHTEVIYIVAHGIATKLFGESAVIGSRHFIAEDEGISISEEQQKIIDDTAQGSSVVYLAIGGQLAGALCINDPPRKEAAKVISDLKNADFRHIVMLTGDSECFNSCFFISIVFFVTNRYKFQKVLMLHLHLVHNLKYPFPKYLYPNVKIVDYPQSNRQVQQQNPYFCITL